MLRPGTPTGPVPPSGPPAPPRRSIPAKPSKEIEGKTTLLDLSDKICKWPIGHPGEPDFHFCGQPSNPGFPYCVEHCAVAYQAQLPRRDRRPPPQPYGAPRLPGPRYGPPYATRTRKKEKLGSVPTPV